MTPSAGIQPETFLRVGLIGLVVSVLLGAVVLVWWTRWRGRQVFVPAPGWPTPPPG
jgi:hypothetical protein